MLSIGPVEEAESAGVFDFANINIVCYIGDGDSRHGYTQALETDFGWEVSLSGCGGMDGCRRTKRICSGKCDAG
jgi:hypothetical protein